MGLDAGEMKPKLDVCSKASRSSGQLMLDGIAGSRTA